jgi:pimeloyl-ACP methyl ester carboxylesterase
VPHFHHNGISFHYQDTGTGRPFVFQHGLGGDVSQPFGLFRPPAGVRLIAFDARGHGRTGMVGDAGGLNFQTFGEDLRALLEHVGVDRAMIGGISMGAALALHFALRWPERVEGLVLSRPAWLEEPCPWNVRMFTLVSTLLRRHGPQQGLDEFQRTPEHRETAERWPDVAQSLSLQFQQPGAAQSVEKLERIITDRPHPDRAAWAGIRVPTLVLGNRADPIHPFEYAEELARAIPGATLREITPKSAGADRHAADVQQALEEFLARGQAPSRHPGP